MSDQNNRFRRKNPVMCFEDAKQDSHLRCLIGAIEPLCYYLIVNLIRELASMLVISNSVQLADWEIELTAIRAQGAGGAKR